MHEDNWLQVGGVLRRTNSLVLQLREHVKAAIAWKALDALEAAEGLEGLGLTESLRSWLSVLARHPQSSEDVLQDEESLTFEDEVDEADEVEDDEVPRHSVT